jgi:hypothetical protein
MFNFSGINIAKLKFGALGWKQGFQIYNQPALFFIYVVAHSAFRNIS